MQAALQSLYEVGKISQPCINVITVIVVIVVGVAMFKLFSGK